MIKNSEYKKDVIELYFKEVEKEEQEKYFL